jgi:membrane protease YdiL (CAAX protease family)
MADQKRRRFVGRIAILRLLAFFIVLALVYGGSQFGIGYAAHFLVPKQFVTAFLLSGMLVASLLAIGFYVLLVAWLERRRPKELALSRGIPLLVGGILLAVVMFTAVYAVLWGLGDAQWHGVTQRHSVVVIAGVAYFVAIAVGSGVGEELLFRGGVFRILEDMFGTAIALLVSGALFGAMHLVNPHATIFSAVAIALEAGVMLAAAYAATRNLWLPIGIHIGWNFAEGGIFGAAVSGTSLGHGILDVPLSGPPLLTGGEFGPEASVIAIAVCSVVGLYFIVRTIRRGRWVPLSFHMMLD